MRIKVAARAFWDIERLVKEIKQPDVKARWFIYSQLNWSVLNPTRRSKRLFPAPPA
jgi:hypothetical protein